MDKKEKFIKSVIHIVTFDNRKYEQIEVLYDQLIKTAVEEYLQEKLNDYDVSSLEYKIIEAWIKAIREE